MTSKRKDGGAGPDRAALSAMRKRMKAFLLPDVTPGYCFTLGTNGFGALGLGEDVVEKFRAAHVDVAGKRLLGVACGGMHTVALAEDGSIYTWGVNDEGALGRPTSGTAWEAEPESSKEDPNVPGKARLPDGVACVQVVAGDGFTFALSDQGSIYGWGQFKDDLSSFYSFSADVKVQRLPALVFEPEDKRDRVKKLAAGARHMLALTRRGEVLSWGIAGQGQLGRVQPFKNEEYPPADVLLQPAAVNGITAAVGADVADIGTGSYASFAIGTRGAVAAWGLNNGGQLGLPVAADKDAEQCVWQPAAVPALSSGVLAIAGGEHHSLALTREHKVLSFGSSNYGMLGRRDIPKPVDKETICLPDPGVVDESDGLAEEKVVSIAAGMHVSSCVTESGNAFTWGSNVNYQMAKGQDEDDNEQPTRMRRHKAFGNRRVLEFCFGGQHAALLASADEQEAAAAPAAAAGSGAAPAAAAAAANGTGPSTAAEAGTAAAEQPAAAPKQNKREATAKEAAAAPLVAAEAPAAAAEEQAAAAAAAAAAAEEHAAEDPAAAGGEETAPSKGKLARKAAAEKPAAAPKKKRSATAASGKPTAVKPAAEEAAAAVKKAPAAKKRRT